MEDAQQVATPPDEFASVEVFGHSRHVGRISEVERFGTKMMRIDVPDQTGKFDGGYTTFFLGGASIFRITPCDLAAVEKHNKPYHPIGRRTASETLSLPVGEVIEPAPGLRPRPYPFDEEDDEEEPF